MVKFWVRMLAEIRQFCKIFGLKQNGHQNFLSLAILLALALMAIGANLPNDMIVFCIKITSPAILPKL